MKKLLSFLLSAAMIISVSASLLTASADSASAHGWNINQIFGSGSDFNVTVNEDSSYNLSTNESACFLTEQAYDVTKTDLSFKFTSPQAGWYVLTVAKSDVDINTIGSTLAYEETPTRVDFLIYNGNNAFCRQSTDDANGTVSQDVYDHIDFNDNNSHTFGIVKQGDNWYPVVDGNVKNNLVSAKLNAFMNANGSNLHYGIGVYNPFDENNLMKELYVNIENVNFVPRIWERKTGYSNDIITTQTDGTSELELGESHNSVFATFESYDLTQKDMEFVVPADVAKNFFVIGLGTDFSNAGDSNYAIVLCDGGNKIDDNNKSRLVAGYNPQGWGKGDPFAKVFDIGASNNQTHTFGLREKDGKYYPAVDGKVLELNTTDANAAALYNEMVQYVNDNKTALKFCIGDFGGPYTVKNVKIVDINTTEPLWADVDPNNLTLHEDKSGVYSSKGTSRVYTTQKINLAENDVTFKFDETVDFMYLAFSSDLGAINSGFCNYDNPQFNNCIEFTAQKNGDKLGTHLAFVRALNNDNGNDWLAANYASETNSIDFSVPHSYGLRKYQDHWYLALDGVIINTGVTSEHLDALMADGKTDFYVTVGSWGAYYTAEGLEVTKQCEIGDANNDGAVNIVDLVRVKKLAADVDSPRFVPLADMNGDSSVNSSDLVVLKSNLLNR